MPGPAVAILSYSFFPAIIFMIAMLIGLFLERDLSILIVNLNTIIFINILKIFKLFFLNFLI
ncbi:MAG: hypothetical protein CM15mP81_09630 [Alphaproteobacteria bacterium]|nr:MAG: hypothetical protein CM15mP81_09630 [Alphaproteobacteria bacterium]